MTKVDIANQGVKDFLLELRQWFKDIHVTDQPRDRFFALLNLQRTGDEPVQ